MMKSKIFILFFLLCPIYYTLLNAQKSKINNDSLSTYSYSALEEKFYNLKESNKIEKSISVAQYYLIKAKEEKNNNHIAEGYVMLHYNQPFKRSLQYIDSLVLFEKYLPKKDYPTRIYLLKGRIYYDYDKEKLALNNFITALKYAKEKDNKRHIAIAEIYIAYLNNYIGKHAEAAKVLQYYYYNGDFLSDSEHEHVRLNLASTLLDINNLEPAVKLIHEGLKNTSEKKDIERYNKYLLFLGLYNLKSKHCKLAINNLNKCKAYFLKKSDNLNSSYALLYLGQSHAQLQEREKAVEYFLKIDSIVQKTHTTFPELKEVYPYVIEYYKSKNDKEKQLYYIERFLTIYKDLDSKFRYISRELPRRYDAPKLLQEKENIINEIERKRTTSYVIAGILLLGMSILIPLYFRSKKAEKRNRKIAQELIRSVNDKAVLNKDNSQEDDSPGSITVQQEDITGKTSNIIPDYVVQNILKELAIFEDKENYLKKGVTLSNLAKKIKTNSKYLSEIINKHKGKNFAAYLNELRIDYAINRLARDKKFRSYKIPFIAEELGYNNEQAFTLAFKKKTGTPLTTYLKEIEKAENKQIKRSISDN
ncbi:helix-turn-helix domain-containing protein [Chryseobacterium salviniae]|uniref:Helix-turn-helix domain-containing protein n=1 Tax=Chryseobacterium salviniae TaxID=3101750 RepID=A0ABU6HY90_9FLAO|nr:helix-turn-helix domain-containing protein [Chryseobacterium sp. T9W2-O]MEC3877803.1 helix-turn-helix domain-containing protein [Chryseobacterium sp. T9W2-O]